MRKLAEELGVAPMALYRHVANKDDLIDGMVDVVFGEIGLPPAGDDWRTAMRQRAISVRDVAVTPSLGDRPDGVAARTPGRPTCATTTR